MKWGFENEFKKLVSHLNSYIPIFSLSKISVIFCAGLGLRFNAEKKQKRFQIAF